MTVRPLFGDGDTYPVGTHVYREPCKDVDQILRDLPLLKDLGFNMVKVQESWAMDEPAEGKLDLETVSAIISEAGKNDLGVYVGFTMEQAPAWMWNKFPNAFMVDAGGHPNNDPTQYLLDCDGKPGPCWDHPGARGAATDFLQAAVAELSQHQNIWTWNVWQEVGFWWNTAGQLGLCYCPHSLTHYRHWLETRYGSIASLNQAWNTAYSEWDHIEPPRRLAGVPPFTDWRYFMENVYLTQALEWKTRAVKERDPARRPVFSHVAAPRPGSTSERRWARVGDFFGTSNYPATEPFEAWDDAAAQPLDESLTYLYETWNVLLFRNDLVRCAMPPNQALWGAEFQGGPGSNFLRVGRTPRKADVRRWFLAGLASGMHGISFWNHRRELMWQENNAFGLLDRHGNTTERMEEVSRIARAINRDPAVFSRGVVPRADVGILLSDHQHAFMQSDDGAAAQLLHASVRGHYARLWRMGIPPDFLDLDESSADELAYYKALILPFPIALSKVQADLIQAYAQNGGTLISEAVPGRTDHYGYCSPSGMFAGADELFGATHLELKRVDEPSPHKRWTGHWPTTTPRGYGELAPPARLEGISRYSGCQPNASFYLQTLSPTTAEPVLKTTAGEVAAVTNHFGRGVAVLVGTMIGLSGTSHISDADDQFVMQLLDDAGVQAERIGELVLRRRVLKSSEAWFLMNPTTRTVSTSVPMDGYTFKRDLLEEIQPGPDEAIAIELAAADIACLIVERA